MFSLYKRDVLAQVVHVEGTHEVLESELLYTFIWMLEVSWFGDGGQRVAFDEDGANIP